MGPPESCSTVGVGVGTKKTLGLDLLAALIEFYHNEIKPVCAAVKFKGDSEVGSLFIAPLGQTPKMTFKTL